VVGLAHAAIQRMSCRDESRLAAQAADAISRHLSGSTLETRNIGSALGPAISDDDARAAVAVVSRRIDQVMPSECLCQRLFLDS